MKADIRRTRDTALSELAKTYEIVRDELADRMEQLAVRIDDLDARRLGDRAYSSARDLRTRVERRMRPAPPPRRVPWAMILACVATVGIAWMLYDRSRRDMIQGRIKQLSARAQEQVAPSMRTGISSAVDGVMGRVKGVGRTVDEGALQREVEMAVGTEPDEGLQIAVEGRTVYLRGMVDSSVSDRAAARAQQVDGVAAVVNLTTTPPSSGPGPARTATTARRTATN